MPAPVRATIRSDPAIIPASFSCSSFTGASLSGPGEPVPGAVESGGMLASEETVPLPLLDLPGPSKPIRVEPIEEPKPLEVPDREPEESPGEREPEEVPA